MVFRPADCPGELDNPGSGCVDGLQLLTTGVGGGAGRHPRGLQEVEEGEAQVLTNKTRIHLRFASVRTYTFFTTGFPRFLSIRGARGLLALNQVLICLNGKPLKEY
jgi:hypothetical protein